MFLQNGRVLLVENVHNMKAAYDCSHALQIFPGALHAKSVPSSMHHPRR